MTFINTRTHGLLDYLAGAVLILAPHVFGFAGGGFAHLLPVILGSLIIVMSLLTAYEVSAAKVIPLLVHLKADVVGGAFLAVSPWIFGFAEVAWWPHLLVGLMLMSLGSLTQRQADVTSDR